MLIEISIMEKKLDELVIDNRNLQREMYRLSANDMIRKKATKDLDMVEPRKRPEIVFYKDKNQANAESDMLSELFVGPDLIFQNPNSLINAIGE